MNSAALLTLFAAVSQTFNLPPGLLAGICYVESHYDIKAVHIDDGDFDSIGVCQVQMPTARSLGFQGTIEQLQSPGVNAYFAGKYLSHQLNCYSGSVHKSIAAYNSGTWKVNKRGKTINQAYVDKVTKAWSYK